MAFQTKLLNGLQEFINQITEYVKLCVVPVGTVTMYIGKGTAPPKGWLFCNGATISESAYPKLYALIGSKTPNMDGRFPMGTNTAGEVGTRVVAGLPNITGTYDAYDLTNDVTTPVSTGAFYYYRGNCRDAANGSNRGYAIGFDASKGQTNTSGEIMSSGIVYGKSNTVQPPAIKMRYIIRAE